MRQMTLLFLLLYAIDVSVCLFAIKSRKSWLYVVTKPLLMPLLCFLYMFLLPEELRNFGSQKNVILALSLHTLGDICLLFPRGKDKRMFFLGMICFFTGHIFYSTWFINSPANHSNNVAIVAFMVIFLVEYLLYRQLILGPRKYAPILVPYSFGLCFVFVSIASTFASGVPFYASLASLIGISLFYFSDFCIMRRLIRLPLFGQMMVMGTYIAGQSLIVLGMLLMQV